MSGWYGKVKQVLIENSEEVENTGGLFGYVIQWDYVDYVDTGFIESTCSLCGKHPLRYLYTIENKNNGEQLEVGSSCIKLFSEDIGDKYTIEEVRGTILDIEFSKELKKGATIKAVGNKLKIALDKSALDNKTEIKNIIKKVLDNDLKIRPRELKQIEGLFTEMSSRERSIVNSGLKVQMRSAADKNDCELYMKSSSDFKLILTDVLTSTQKSRLNAVKTS